MISLAHSVGGRWSWDSKPGGAQDPASLRYLHSPIRHQLVSSEYRNNFCYGILKYDFIQGQASKYKQLIWDVSVQVLHWIDTDLILCLAMADFRKCFANAKHIAIISGAGVSAESGVPTFRGDGGYWRKWQAQVSNVSRTFKGSSE
jgi:hypothetical protein